MGGREHALSKRQLNVFGGGGVNSEQIFHHDSHEPDDVTRTCKFREDMFRLLNNLFAIVSFNYRDDKHDDPFTVLPL